MGVADKVQILLEQVGQDTLSRLQIDKPTAGDCTVLLTFFGKLNNLLSAPTLPAREQHYEEVQIPEGWDVGPAEPTSEMLKAGCIAGLAIETLLDDKPYACEAAIYKAMRAASPTLPTLGQHHEEQPDGTVIPVDPADIAPTTPVPEVADMPLGRLH